MRKHTIVILVVLAMVVSAGLAVAVAPRGGGKGGRGMGMRGMCPMMGAKLAAELGLTDAQVAQMKTLHQEFVDGTKATRERMMAKRKEMADLWSADQPDADGIKAAAAEMDGLRAQMRDTGIDYLIKALGMLTPDQRVKLRTIMRNRPDACPCPGCPMGMGPGMMGCGGGFGMGPAVTGGMGNCPMAK
jgi:Spy/CpxP family protein refolding chaperone